MILKRIALLAVFVVTACSSASDLPEGTIVGDVPESQAQILEQQVAAAVSGERRFEGLGPLSHNTSSALSAAARAHSFDMAQRGYFSHQSPDGVGPFERASAHQPPLPNVIGETLWMRSMSPGQPINVALVARDTVQDWMGSAGHQSVLMDPKAIMIGVGAHITETTIHITLLTAKDARDGNFLTRN